MLKEIINVFALRSRDRGPQDVTLLPWFRSGFSGRMCGLKVTAF